MPGLHLEARHFYVFVQVEYFPKQDMQKKGNPATKALTQKM